jgi:hypothetical protein
MAYLEIGSRSEGAPALSNGEIGVSEAAALAIAEQASEMQQIFLAKVGLTVRQAKRLKPAEKEDLERKYTAFLLG